LPEDGVERGWRCNDEAERDRDVAGKERTQATHPGYEVACVGVDGCRDNGLGLSEFLNFHLTQLHDMTTSFLESIFFSLLLISNQLPHLVNL